MAIQLTPKERAVFDFLKSKKGICTTRREITVAVFGVQHAESNVVDVHVKNLRHKIGRYAIESVRGQGYKLDVSAAILDEM